MEIPGPSVATIDRSPTTGKWWVDCVGKFDWLLKAKPMVVSVKLGSGPGKDFFPTPPDPTLGKVSPLVATCP